MNKKIIYQTMGFIFLRCCVGIVLFILVVIAYDIISKGAGSINWDELEKQI